MEKVFDVTALGELLIDFTENGISSQGNPLLEANPGVRLAMCWLCFASWAEGLLLSVRWEMTILAGC